VSLWRDDPKPSATTLATLVAIAIVAVGGLSRLFVGPRYLAWALGAVAIGAASALLFGRRSLGLGFGVLLVGWVLTLPGLFVRHDGATGFPTATTLRIAWKLIGSGLTDVPKAVPPIDAEPKYLILVWTALLFLGFLGAAWVVVRRPVGAIISALGVVTFSGSLGDGPGRSVYAIAAVAVTGAFFLSEGRQRISRWASGRIRVPVWFGLPTLGAACGFAVAAPFLVGDAPLVELRSAIRPRLVIIKPLSDIRRQLRVDPPIEVMRVGSDRATYWRLTALDEYDGKEWVLEARPRTVRNGIVRAPTPITTGDILEQHYRLTSLLSPWMPAAYAARSVEPQARAAGTLAGTVPSVELDARSQTLLLRDESTPGLVYTVRSQLPHISANLPSAPRDVDDSNERLFGEQARPLVSGALTPLDTARRLEAHFRAFTYNEDVDGGHSVSRLQRFLQERAGYCEQFAATMTLMLRGLGIEARVGVGFLPGAASDGEYIVSTREAHAWVEANVPGAGWTTFDPTPGRGDASPTPPETEETVTQSPQPVPQETTVATTPEPQAFPSDVTKDTSGVPMTAVWLAVALAVLIAIPVAKRIRRGLRQVGDPSEVILGAYAELTDRARELGLTAVPSETHREFFTRALGSRATDQTDLAYLTARVLYGPPGSTIEEAHAAWAALGPTLRVLRQQSPWWRRALAPIDLTPFLPQRLLGRVRLRVNSALARG
jgi:transglutaminase-like putative cysteine protease